MTRARWWTCVRLLTYAAVLVFLGWQVWRVRVGLADSLRTVGWPTALVAGLLAAVGGVPGFLGWRLLLAGLGSRLGWRDAAWVFFLAGLTRYVPGGIWPTVAHAALARPLRQPPARLAAAFLLSQGLGVLSGLLVGVLALPWLVGAQPLWWLLVPVLVGALLPLALPGLLARLVGIAARLVRRGAPVDASGRGAPTLPSRAVLFRVTALMLVGWVVSGLHVTVLATAFGADPTRAFALGVGGFALAVVSGIFAVVLPTGFGVRELALAVTLATLLTGSDLVTLVALSRVLLTLGDIGSTAVVLGALVGGRWVRGGADPVGVPDTAAAAPVPPPPPLALAARDAGSAAEPAGP